MSVELLQTMSLVVFIAAGVFFVLAIALFFLLDVPRIIGDLTGRNAKKAIEQIRQQNERDGNKAHKPSPVNMERGQITDRISATGSLYKQETIFDGSVGTEKISTARLVQPNGEETTILQGQGETTVLSEQSATTLLQGFGDTTELNGQESPYQGEGTIEPMMNHQTSFVCALEYELGYLGSDELIE